MKKGTINYLLTGLVAILIGNSLYFLTSHILDCSEGHDVYSEVIITDKQFREAWEETYTETKTASVAGKALSAQVVKRQYHATHFIIYYADTSGYHIANVDEILYKLYPIGSHAKLRTRIGKSGCRCSETVI